MTANAILYGTMYPKMFAKGLKKLSDESSPPKLAKKLRRAEKMTDILVRCSNNLRVVRYRDVMVMALENSASKIVQSSRNCMANFW